MFQMFIKQFYLNKCYVKECKPRSELMRQQSKRNIRSCESLDSPLHKVNCVTVEK